VFLVNVPVALAAVPAGILLLPESRRPGVPPLDLAGVALSVLALTGIAFALIQGADDGFTSPPVVAAGVAGVLAAIGFIVFELRAPHPLFDVRVLVRPRVFAGAFGIFAIYVAFFGVFFLLPQYLQYVQDRSALASGLLLLPTGIAMGVISPLSGRLLARLGPRTLIPAGLTGMAAGCAIFLALSADSSDVLVCLGMGLLGAFLACTIGPATAVIMNDLGTDKAGDAAAANQLARQVGGAMGIAVVGSVFAAVYAARIDDRLGGLAGAVRETVRDSVEGAAQVGATLAPVRHAQLVAAADHSFDVAARFGFGVCAALLLAAALVSVVGLARPAVQPAAAPA
jgi:Na+/melibiose symporter-like transporter